MIGISFKQTKLDKFLKKLFNNIDLSKYSFSFLEDEIYDKNNLNFNSFGNKNFIKNPSDFINYDYYIIFLVIHVYLKNGRKKIIDNYEDFLNSDCQLMVLITDSECFEIYFKNLELQNQIISNIENLDIDYKIKTIDNDTRYNMHVN